MAKTTDYLDWAGTRITIRPTGARIQDHRIKFGILDLPIGGQDPDHLDPESLNDQDLVFDINRI